MSERVAAAYFERLTVHPELKRHQRIQTMRSLIILDKLPYRQ